MGVSWLSKASAAHKFPVRPSTFGNVAGQVVRNKQAFAHTFSGGVF